MSRIPSIAIVGTGAVAHAVALAHSAAGGNVAAIVSRDQGRAEALAGACRADAAGTGLSLASAAEVVLVCVADRAVADLGRRLRTGTPPAGPVLHTSGALAGAALMPPDVASGDAGAAPDRAAGEGALRVGSLHPLQSFPAGLTGPDGRDALVARVRGAHWFHEGCGADEAGALVGAWGGSFHALAAGSKALYHGAAAILSNHTVALFADATRLFELAGVPSAESRAALATLLEGTAANLRAVGVPQALTGPVARGDADTVRRHVTALRRFAPELEEAYAAMARRTIAVALAKGTLGPDAAAAIAQAVDRPEG